MVKSLDEFEDLIDVHFLAKLASRVVRLDQDAVFAISGDEGSGKSTLAGGFGIHADSQFAFERNALFSPTEDEVKAKVVGLPKYAVIIADEAIKVLYKLDWQSKSQKFLNKLYALCRKENKISILCIPRFTDLNEYFRNHRVKFWLHIVSKITTENPIGYAVLFKKTWVPYSKDPWNLDGMHKKVDEYSKKNRLKEVEFTLEDKIAVLSKHDNFLAIVRFEWMPPRYWEEYSKLKAEVTYDEEEAVDKVSERYKMYIRELVGVLIGKGESYATIGKALGLKDSTIFSWHKGVKAVKEATPELSKAA